MIDTISQIFLNTIKTYAKPDLLAAKAEGRYVPISTDEFARRVKNLSLGLADIGLTPGEKLIIFSENRPEWTITDFAVLCAGGITVPIYTSLMPEQVKYIINDSDARIVVCSNRDLWLKVDAVRSDLRNVHHFVLIDEEGPQGVLSLSEIMARGKTIAASNPGLFEKRALAVKPSDVASIIYTSGTTG
ncbi:MAG: AMP-binding protein, partial [Candidatus Aminicenantales bacterium]